MMMVHVLQLHGVLRSSSRQSLLQHWHRSRHDQTAPTWQQRHTAKMTKVDMK